MRYDYSPRTYYSSITQLVQLLLVSGPFIDGSACLQVTFTFDACLLSTPCSSTFKPSDCLCLLYHKFVGENFSGAAGHWTCVRFVQRRRDAHACLAADCDVCPSLLIHSFFEIFLARFFMMNASHSDISCYSPRWMKGVGPSTSP
jgi:hypothetical protein